jgi:NH3-dependent NAD+ synthetase
MKFLGEQGSALNPTTLQEFTAENSSIGTRTYVLMAIAKKNLQ